MGSRLTGLLGPDHLLTEIGPNGYLVITEIELVLHDPG